MIIPVILRTGKLAAINVQIMNTKSLLRDFICDSFMAAYNTNSKGQTGNVPSLNIVINVHPRDDPSSSWYKKSESESDLYTVEQPESHPAKTASCSMIVIDGIGSPNCPILDELDGKRSVARGLKIRDEFDFILRAGNSASMEYENLAFVKESSDTAEYGIYQDSEMVRMMKGLDSDSQEDSEENSENVAQSKKPKME